MGETSYPINLTEQEREKLEVITAYGRHSTQKITRARILLKADKGESDSAIADALGCEPALDSPCLHLMNERDGRRAARAQRVADSDRAASDVERPIIDAEFAPTVEGLAGKISLN